MRSAFFLRSWLRLWRANTALASGLAVCAASVVFAAEPAPAAEKGELLLQDDFKGYAAFTKERQPAKAPGWVVRVAHATWEPTAEGVRSVWTSGHNPVLVYEGNFGDVIVEVDFRYTAEPGRWAACRVSASNGQLDPRAYAVSAWANVDNLARGRGFVLENEVWGGYIIRTGYTKAQFAPDTWHTLRLEVVGDTARADCAGFTVRGRHEKYGLPKTSLWLGTGQSAHELRNLRIYAVKRAPEPAGSAPAK